MENISETAIPEWIDKDYQFYEEQDWFVLFHNHKLIARFFKLGLTIAQIKQIIECLERDLEREKR